MCWSNKGYRGLECGVLEELLPSWTGLGCVGAITATVDWGVMCWSNKGYRALGCVVLSNDCLSELEFDKLKQLPSLQLI